MPVQLTLLKPPDTLRLVRSCCSPYWALECLVLGVTGLGGGFLSNHKLLWSRQAHVIHLALNLMDTAAKQVVFLHHFKCMIINGFHL